jgi:hypothetical protein
MKLVLSKTSYENEHIICDAYRVDDAYPGEKKVQDGEDL